MTFRDFFSFGTMFALVGCMLAQLVIDLSQSNMFSTLIIALTTVLTLAYLYWSNAYTKTAISAFVLIGLLFTGSFGALIFQTLYWNPVSKYLFNSELTFGRIAIYQVIALASHFTYLTLFNNFKDTSTNNSLSLRSILTKIGLYNVPSVHTVWIVAFLGLSALILGKILPGEIGRGIFNFRFLMWFPFFIIIYIHNFGIDYANKKKQYIFIFLFFFLICAAGISFNSRSLVVAALVNLFILAIVILLFKNEKYSLTFYTKSFLLIILMVGLLKPFSGFSDAMLIARQDRDDVSPITMLKNTFDIYINSSDKELVGKDKFIQNKIYTNYDEDYIENGVLTRFVLTKFHDNAYYYSSGLRESGKVEVKKHLEGKFIAIMPQPVIDMFGIELDKMEHMNSTTDILVHETTGRRLGGLKVASSFVNLEVVFGLYAPFIFFAMSFIFFLVIDLYSHVDKVYGLVISFPFFAIASQYILFQLPVYGLQGVVNFLVRGFVTDVLIFCAIMFVLNTMFKPHLKYT